MQFFKNLYTRFQTLFVPLPPAEDKRQRRGATAERRPAVLQGTWARRQGNLVAFIVLGSSRPIYRRNNT